MAEIDFPIKLLSFEPGQTDYTSKNNRGPQKNIPIRNRPTHGQKVLDQFHQIFIESDIKKVAAIKARGGLYVQFRGLPEHDLITKSLENLTKGVRLLNITPTREDNVQGTEATVFVPFGQEKYFINKVQDYLNDDKYFESNGKPKNQDLIDGIENVSAAIVEALWTDKLELFPGDDEIWCEVWLRIRNCVGETVEAFKVDCHELDISIGTGFIEFPERVVIPILANRSKLSAIFSKSALLAEIRLLAETAHFWLELSNVEQLEWVDNLIERTNIDEDSKVSVLILDTGINRGHRLLHDIIEEDHQFSVKADWGVNDHDRHGTLMAGTVAYGDIIDLVNNDASIAIGLKIESGKILPPQGENDKELYGYYTSQLISQAELNITDKFRIIAMAVAEDKEYDGRPSSWSGAIDAISSGASDDRPRFFILSSGNVHPDADFLDSDYHYFDSNNASRIESPGQSWNALTVGSMTRKTILREQDLEDYKPVAPQGGISPFTKTSTLWDDKWPIKPEIVMEGGNIAIDNALEFYTVADDLSLMSTFYDPTIAQFGQFNMSSASVALAANMAAKIAYAYPEFWPETVRGLIVHSSDWTSTMKGQFLRANPQKQDYYRLMRACGYGVPNLDKAIRCASNSMTMIMQQNLQPFAKGGKENNYRSVTKDMHFHELALPTDLLVDLGNIPVKLRITLSYFIEPGPGEIGWKDRYRYPSHGLRFDINNPQETEQQFKQRVNKLTEEKEESFRNNPARWVIGKARDKGSIHSDIIETTASEIATCKMIAIYPTIGWWRERKHLGKTNKKCRYSLIISLETPEQNVDIYAMIAQEIENRIKIEASVDISINT